MSKPDIFFSYAREDQARVALVVAALEAHNWSVFWDRRIPAGQSWRSHIGRALEQARCVIVAWSEHSIQSNWVIEEADEGKRRGILVPAFLDAVLPPWGFRGIHAADLSGWSPERPSPAFDSFLADLGMVLGTPHPEPSPSLPVARISSVKQGPGDGDELTTLEQGAAVDLAGGAGAASPLVAETPALPARQPSDVGDAPTRHEVEVDPAPPGGSSQPTEAVHPVPIGAVLAELAWWSRMRPKAKDGRWWLGVALIAGTVSAGSYAYFGLRPNSELVPANPETAQRSEPAESRLSSDPRDEAFDARSMPESALASQKTAPTSVVGDTPNGSSDNVGNDRPYKQKILSLQQKVVDLQAKIADQ
jgi:hypothetical protein